MRIAHFSDPHILDLTGVGSSRLLLNKRFTGWLNLKMHRGAVHKRDVVETLVDDVRGQRIDHVVVTGDVTNLALPPEFERALSVFAGLGLDAQHLSVVPGNHDVYTHGAQRSRRFAGYFAGNVASDVDLGPAHPSGPFPYVQLRGPVAFIGLSTAVARPPLISSGHAGRAEIDALARALALPEVRSRIPVVLVHHPLINPRGALATFARGLREAATLRALVATVPRAMVLHGHLHKRAHRVIDGPDGARIDHIGATSASLLHDDPDRVAGYNVYDVTATGLDRVGARVYDRQRRTVHDADVPHRDAAYAD